MRRVVRHQPKPAYRNYGFENQLCDAIRRQVLVELRYKDDFAFRTIAPNAVFETEKGSVCLSCFQLRNPEKPADDDEPRNFTVGDIIELRLTDRRFRVDPRFNPGDAKYTHGGVICMVQRG